MACRRSKIQAYLFSMCSARLQSVPLVGHARWKVGRYYDYQSREDSGCNAWLHRLLDGAVDPTYCCPLLSALLRLHRHRCITTFGWKGGRRRARTLHRWTSHRSRRLQRFYIGPGKIGRPPVSPFCQGSVPENRSLHDNGSELSAAGRKSSSLYLKESMMI
jgi:hypothetical protein